MSVWSAILGWYRSLPGHFKISVQVGVIFALLFGWFFGVAVLFGGSSLALIALEALFEPLPASDIIALVVAIILGFFVLIIAMILTWLVGFLLSLPTAAMFHYFGPPIQ